MFDRNAVQAWIADDPDEATAKELQALLDRADAGDSKAGAEISDRFSAPLQFGTAGLRGALGAGPNRMNRAMVMRAAAGLARYLRANAGEQFTVVVGYDARHYSKRFALDTAAVITAAGGTVSLLPSALPTPVLAFAVRELNADAGVMVTASHNPPQDNGYKVYLGGSSVAPEARGVQLVSPADQEIASEIAAIGSVRDLPRAESGWQVLGDGIVARYRQRVVATAPSAPTPLRIVYTAMHGVGGELCTDILRSAGFGTIYPVAAQQQPDPDFPTVKFPNPEEPGALNLAIELANRVDADLILANDPDADRLAVAIPTAHGWRQLSGDEVGQLLGTQAAQAAALHGSGTLAASIVSSGMLRHIAAAHGLNFAATLTGFKWISRTKDLIFGYEEALGYCCDPQAVRDKDGISAAVAISALASKMAAKGLTLADELDDLARRYGVHATDPLTIRVDDLAIIPAAMTLLRDGALTHLAGSAITEMVDYRDGTADLPPTDALRFETADGARVLVRPSGTEPKLKCYLEVTEPVSGSLAVARERASERCAEMKAELAALLQQVQV